MLLRSFDRHDHPDAHPFLPQVGCGICGVAVQPRIPDGAEWEHWDDLDAKLQDDALEEMTAWSHRHAAAHTDTEHAEHQRRLGAIL